MGVENSCTHKFWQGLSSSQDRLSLKFSQQFGIQDTVARSLARRNLAVDEIEDYINPTLNNSLFDPLRLLDMEKAARRLFETLTRQENTGIIFSPSAEALFSVAAFTQWLSNHHQNFSYKILDPETDGLLPTQKHFDALAVDHAVILCIGCGTNLPPDFNTPAGTDVIVVDNAISTETLPHLFALINSNRFNENPEFSYLGTTGLLFLLLVAINRLCHENNLPSHDLTQFLDLIAAGTAAESLPMVRLNRAFIRQGIELICRRTRMGLYSLIDQLVLDRPITSYRLGSVVCDSMVCGELVDKPDLGLRLLNSSTKPRAKRIGDELAELHSTATDLKDQFFENYVDTVWQRDVRKPLVWGVGSGCPANILKRITKDICQLTGRTTVLFGVQNTRAIAFGHSIVGVNLGVVVANCINEGLVISGGGNANSVRFDVLLQDISDLVEYMTELVSKQWWNREEFQKINVDGVLYASGVSLKLVEAISALEPFGIGSPRPRLVFPYHSVTSCRKIGNDSARLILLDEFGSTLEGYVTDSNSSNLVKFFTKYRKHKIHFAGYLTIRNRKGNDVPVLRIEDAALAN